MSSPMTTLEVPYRSIPDMFFQRVAATPDARAFGYPGAAGPAWLTWAEARDRAVAIAAGLRGLGVGHEDRVAIVANTRLEWVLADLGIMCAGGATTTVYPTTEAADAAFIVRNSGSKVVIAEDASQVAKLAGQDLPSLTHVVIMDGEDGDASATPPSSSLAQLEEDGRRALADDPDLINNVVAEVAPDHLATLMYTSGATGQPKGVQLLHRGWCWQGVAQGDLGIMTRDDLQFLWLPLSHSFGKTVLCGLTHAGMETYVDGRMDKIVENLALIRPTLMCGAPRIFEKVYNRVVTNAQASPVKSRIFAWALRVGKQVVAREQTGTPVPGWLAFRYRLATRLVFSKIQARLGGRIRTLVSGSAPLSRDIATFFAAAGLPILEGYGLTEASAGNFVNRPGKLKIGTVGQPLGDLEVRIDSDGEVLLRGAPVMRGYHDLPEQTAEAFTEDGWFRTGDIGTLDDESYLTITDRKKDLVKTSGGKYIAPSAIEGMFKAICPYTSQAVVIAQGRNFCTMLVTLDPDAITGWAVGGPLEGKPYEEIVTSPEVEAMVDGYVKELNTRLNRWETVKKFAILPRDLTVEDGEITPSMKVKRRGVEASFSETIDKLYADAVAQLPS